MPSKVSNKCIVLFDSLAQAKINALPPLYEPIEISSLTEGLVSGEFC
jgi:hypothetical protein